MNLVVYHNPKIFHHVLLRNFSIEVCESEMRFGGRFAYRSVLKFKNTEDMLGFIELVSSKYPDFEIAGQE